MKSQLLIPSKIKVGYQEREDTYTKKLAYIIYYDGKGVLRKETSWRNWIDSGDSGMRGEYVNDRWTQVLHKELVRGPLPTHDFENVPTEGFVLNKKAGGYSTGWNHRATYCRVWDPRGFEFEISIPNLLFILQECSSLKGKGLDGSFVYAWDGKDLVLLPTTSQEYTSSNQFTKLQDGKVAAKDLVGGYTYETKKQETLIYLGKFEWIEFNWRNHAKYTKKFVFVDEKGNNVGLDNVSTLARVVSDEIVSNYSDLVEAYGQTDQGGGIKGFTVRDTSINKDAYSHETVFEALTEGQYRAYDVTKIWDKQDYWAYNKKMIGFELTPIFDIFYDNGKVKEKKVKSESKRYTLTDVNDHKLKTVSLKLYSGKEVQLN